MVRWAAVRALSLLTVTGFAVSALAVTCLAVARPDLSVSDHPISEYAHGPYSYVQVGVFVVVGASSLALAAGVRLARPATRWPRLRVAMLALWGAAMIIAGLVDVEDAVLSTGEGVVHQIVVEVAFVSLLTTMALSNHVRRRHDRPLGTSHVWTAVAAAALVLTALLDGGPWFGLAQRLLAGTAVSWLTVVALRLPRASGGPQTYPRRCNAS